MQDVAKNSDIKTKNTSARCVEVQYNLTHQMLV